MPLSFIWSILSAIIFREQATQAGQIGPLEQQVVDEEENKSNRARIFIPDGGPAA